MILRQSGDSNPRLDYRKGSQSAKKLGIAGSMDF